MKTLKALDNYFIGAGEGTFEDRFWFYGSYVLCFTLVAITLSN